MWGRRQGQAERLGPAAQTLLSPRWLCSLEASGIEGHCAPGSGAKLPGLPQTWYSRDTAHLLTLHLNYSPVIKREHSATLSAYRLFPFGPMWTANPSRTPAGRELEMTAQAHLPLSTFLLQAEELRVMLEASCRAERSHGLCVVSRLRVKSIGLPGTKQHAQLLLNCR